MFAIKCIFINLYFYIKKYFKLKFKVYTLNKSKCYNWIGFGDISVEILSNFKSPIYNNNIKREINVIVINYSKEPFDFNLINDYLLVFEDKKTYLAFEDTKFYSERNILTLNGNFINFNTYFNKYVINNSSINDN